MRKQAFTLIEILVVLGITALFLGFVLPQLRSFQGGASLESTGKEIVAILRLAQSRTLASEGSFQYGVYFNTGVTPHEYTLFLGSSYAARNAAQDETTQLPKATEISVVALGGASEVVFLKVTGNPEATGTITFRYIADPSRTKTVSILRSGAIEEDASSPPAGTERIIDSRHVNVQYQGRDIVIATESVQLTFPDTTFSFLIVNSMHAGQIFWEGDVMSEGEIQHLKIHTHILNDPVQGTLFSLHRQRDENTKTLEIILSGDVTGNIIEYDAAGIITQGTSIYAGTPEIQ